MWVGPLCRESPRRFGGVGVRSWRAGSTAGDAWLARKVNQLRRQKGWPFPEPVRDGCVIAFDEYAPALDGIDGFSHLIVLFYLHETTGPQRKTLRARPKMFTRYGLPLEDLPLVGVFCLDSPHRPNPVGLTIVRLLGRQGTFAEYCCVDEKWLYPTPPGVDDEAVAACALVGVTAQLGLFREGHLQPGERVFVNGGSGGVGSMVVQMAKAAGARVITTAGSDDKVALCRELGADRVVNYRTEDLDAAVAEFAPDGVNLFWETRREPDFDRMTACLAERGRGILMAGRDARPEFPVGPFYVKGCSLHGFVMFKASPEELRHCAGEMNRWLVEGKLRARIGARMPLSEAAEAHRLQEQNTLHQAGTLAGKIVLTP